jgi:3-mercaptopyruvate sulfurtransferase SseA
MSASKRSSRSILPLIFMLAGAALIVAALFWFFAQNGRPAAPAPTQPQAAIPFPEISRVGLADAKAAFDTKSTVFVDVRGDPYYSQGHIPGALNISLDDLEARLGELDRAAWIITYCT